MKKIVQVLLICLIIAGIIVISTAGFNVGLKYSEHTEISINIGSQFNVADIEAITKEVFGNTNVLVQQVELYKDMVQITVKEATEEQISSLNDKINEKYEIENQLTDIKIVHISNVRLRSIIKPYILPISIVSIITIVFAMIVFRKLGALKVAYRSGCINSCSTSNIGKFICCYKNSYKQINIYNFHNNIYNILSITYGKT